MRLLFLFPYFLLVLPFSSTSYSSTATRWSRKASLPVVDDDEDDVRQNSEPKSLLLGPE